jgi:peptide/nickel transport system substrate-binding protein
MKFSWAQIKNFFAALFVGIKQLPRLKRRDIMRTLDLFTRKEIYTLLAVAILAIASGVFLFSSLTHQPASGPHPGGEITEGLVGQPQFINPVLALTNNVDTDLSRVVYAQLLKYDDNQNLTPDLAAAMPQVSDDKKIYTLQLKPNLQWQDGKPLTADDVVYTIETIQNADYQSPLRPNWTRVKVEKIDDLTLRFTLREVSISFINNFAIGIMPKHVWGDLSAADFRASDNNLNPVGSGPFEISEIKKTAAGAVKSISLKPNPYYYQGRAYLNEVTFSFFAGYDELINAYQSRDISTLGFVAFDNKAVLAPSDKYNQYQVTLPQYQAVFFNLQKSSVLDEKAVRQALWLTTNRDDIINQVYAGAAAPAYGPILPEALGYNSAVAEAAHLSVPEAEDILDKAGWVTDPLSNIRTREGKTLEFDLVVNGNSPLNVTAAQILQSQWLKAGIRANLVIATGTDLEQKYIRPRAFDALLFSENTGADPDPFPFWDSTQIHDPGLNLSGFSDPEADQLLTEARQTADESLRTKDYLRFQEIINDALPAIFLVRSLYIYDVPKKLQGVDLHNMIQASERFADINKWYIGE